jgi:hypothetical protein
MSSQLDLDLVQPDLANMPNEQLGLLRVHVEAELQVYKSRLRSIVAEVNKRHRAAQLRARFGKAADLLLSVMTVDEIYAKLADLITTGKLVEKTTSVALSEKADVKIVS